MSNRRRASSDWGTEPENESEEDEGEETTSKATRGTDGGLSALVKRRRKKRKKEDVVNMTSAVGLWATSLKGPHLDLMVSLKKLAEVRLMNTGDKSLSSCLTPASLRTIGIILEELIKDRMSTNFPHTGIGRPEGCTDAEFQHGGEGSSLPLIKDKAACSQVEGMEIIEIDRTM